MTTTTGDREAQITRLRVPDALESAAEIVDRGWCRERYLDPETRGMCAVGSVVAAVDYAGTPRHQLAEIDLMSPSPAAIEALAGLSAFLGLDTSDPEEADDWSPGDAGKGDDPFEYLANSIGAWNDDPARSGSQVAYAMRAAAKEMREVEAA